jgi:hypothetical protein
MKGCFANEKDIVANMPNNMSKSQLSALSKLKKDKDIVIKPADKNLGLCIMDKSWYIDECKNILSNKDSYIQIDTPAWQIVDTVERKINILIDRYTQMGILDWNIREFMEKSMKNVENYHICT